MEKSYSCAQMRSIDRAATERYSIPSLLLMENAGRSLVESLCRAMNDDRKESRILIFCGKGNNGGDGFVMARRLRLLGYSVEIIAMTASPDDYRGDAAVNLNILRNLWPDPNLFWFFSNEESEIDRLRQSIVRADWIVDALLGTGSTPGLKKPYSLAVQEINKSKKSVFAVDLPTGLDGDTGSFLDEPIRATVTCTLAGIKTGLSALRAQPYIGRVECGDIGIPVELIDY